MGSDLFQREAMEHLSTLSPVADVPAGVWDGFARGSGLAGMKGLANTGRAIDMLGSVGPVVGDTLSGGTEMQDRYFKEHDDVFNSAVDFWTPKPNEVGVAGEVTGQLLGLLPQVVASPGLAVSATQLGEGEELVRKGVDASTAGKVAAIQATGLGLGIWMPVLGSTLTQRVLLGGAAFNAGQGVVTRGASELLLKDTTAKDEYKAFDPQSLTLDVLLGAAFGSLAHLSPEQRTHGAETWKRIEDWAKEFKPSEIDALATLREAQHMNADSLPGKPEGVADIGLHVDRMRTAIDQVLKDKPVELSDMPEPKLTPDPEREAQMQTNADELVKEAERVRVEEGLQEPSLAEETSRPPVETVPTPPPGTESPARREDPIAAAADRFAAENPDHLIRTGTDAEGKPITKTAKEFLTAARDTSVQAQEDAKLYQIAAECLLGG